VLGLGLGMRLLGLIEGRTALVWLSFVEWTIHVEFA
jgi:hypothetical protein